MTDVQQEPWFLSGNFAPVADETTVYDLEVTGAIPAALTGRYLRNGSNPASGTAGHWFFGDGMVHGIRLEGGRAYVVPQPLGAHDEAANGRWRRRLPETMMDPTASVANTHVIAHAGRIWALERATCPTS